MRLQPDFPESPYAILDAGLRWFPADEALRQSSSEKLLPPLVPGLRKQVKAWRDSRYAGATETGRSLLDRWFGAPDPLPPLCLSPPSASGAPGEGLDEFQDCLAVPEATDGGPAERARRKAR